MEKLGAVIDLNVRGAVHLTALLLPFLKNRGGAIVNICSLAAFQPTPFVSVYGASKAFLLHWSLSLREELRWTEVAVLAACPGPIRTNFFRAAGLIRRLDNLSGRGPIKWLRQCFAPCSRGGR
ncbi:MAG: SDR family NAD(P)-dependent oxidoreductase [Opitutales bacterium]